MPDLRAAELRRQIAMTMLSADYTAAHPDAVAAAEGWLDATTPRALAEELRATAACEDLEPGLGELAIPLLCRVGDRDGATPLPYSQAAQARRSTLQIVPGAWHAFLVEDAPATVEAVVAALAPA